MNSDWKSLKRHPLSQEYRDITGPAWYKFTLKFKKLGFLPDRPIILSGGMVVDGWQRLRACIELDIIPEFATLAEGISAEDYVEAMNDERRHETPVEAAERQARRLRVAAARTEGQSLRTIAEAEEVSESTVRNDLAQSTAQGGCAVEPPDGKVTGKDGKDRPASKPKIRCARCERMHPTSNLSVKDCPQCQTAREAAKHTNGKPAKPEAKPKSGKAKFSEKKFDKAYGALVRVIDERGNATVKGKHHAKCMKILSELIETYKDWKKVSA